MSPARRFSYPAAREGETVEERLLAEGYSKRLIVLLKQLPEGLTVAGERVRSTRPLRPGEILARRSAPRSAPGAPSQRRGSGPL